MLVEHITTNSILPIVQHEGDYVRLKKCCQPFLMSYLSCSFVEHDILPSELNCPCSPFFLLLETYIHQHVAETKNGVPLDLQLSVIFPYHLVISLKLHLYWDCKFWLRARILVFVDIQQVMEWGVQFLLIVCASRVRVPSHYNGLCYRLQSNVH